MHDFFGCYFPKKCSLDISHVGPDACPTWVLRTPLGFSIMHSESVRDTQSLYVCLFHPSVCLSLLLHLLVQVGGEFFVWPYCCVGAALCRLTPTLLELQYKVSTSHSFTALVYNIKHIISLVFWVITSVINPESLIAISFKCKYLSCLYINLEIIKQFEDLDTFSNTHQM